MHGASVDFFVLFFFSSRRRHTRFDCDWSSDVCSSDLGPARPDRGWRPEPAAERAAHAPASVKSGIAARSEEHTSELQSQSNLVCRLLLEKKKIDPPVVLRDRPIPSVASASSTAGAPAT